MNLAELTLNTKGALATIEWPSGHKDRCVVKGFYKKNNSRVVTVEVSGDEFDVDPRILIIDSPMVKVQ